MKYHEPASGAEFVEYEFQEINDTIELQKQFAKTSVKELFATKGNRYRVMLAAALGIFSQFSGNAIIAYYLHTVLDQIGYTDQKQQNLINGCNSILSFFTGIAMALSVERVGRRPLFIFGSTAICLNVVAMTISSSIYTNTGAESAGRAMLAAVFLFGVFYSIAWGGLLYNYSLEIFPYNLRAKGFGLVFFIQSVFQFINTYVNPIAMANLNWKYYIFYCIWDGFEAIFVYFFFIETKGVALEEIAKIFDGDDALVGGGLEMTRKEMELHGVKDVYSHVEYVNDA
ncbi:hexose transporter HXT15 [Sugiyamaella lignohabitans]|uniref:Hexose transporter HXT15 n=1 Tax=Sugiyamaella lignohabitans TaxID=796027 RepID=A0A167CJ15_9ASCO|nr:hexose transporter HXT15 [Sugiyamaella lignohabitans]ANB11763.1 hexose transporter HXT15 [Sugiyamaella lignohabitans]